MKRQNQNFAGSALRERLAQEAARLMIEHGIADFAVAKRKAAERFGVSTRGVLPSNQQIEQSVSERQRIFESERHADHVRALRRTALEVMDALTEFETRLVGPVLAGTATSNATVEVHAFCDSPETVAASLQSQYQQLRTIERRLRVKRNEHALVPGFRLQVNGVDVLIQVFPVDGLRQAPLSPVDKRPMRRAKRAEVAALLER